MIFVSLTFDNVSIWPFINAAGPRVSRVTRIQLWNMKSRPKMSHGRFLKAHATQKITRLSVPDSMSLLQRNLRCFAFFFIDQL